jgi:hypothetical protein
MRGRKQVERRLKVWGQYIIEAITLATVIMGFATAVVGYRANKGRQVDIKTAVNGNYSDVSNRVDQLIAVLDKAGIRIPDKPEGTKGALRTVMGRAARAEGAGR